VTPPPESLFDRSLPARIGIAALNLLLPGLGLVRLGAGLEGGLIAAGTLALMWLMAVLAFVLPAGSFVMGGLILAWFLLVYLVALLFSVVRTWPKSRRERGQEWWSRWYAIILWWLLSAVCSAGSSAVQERAYRGFYVAAESMRPTFEKNEKIVADMRWRTSIVGNIVLVRDRDGTIRIYRVAAIGGQTFAMRGGVPIIDGKAASESQIGETVVGDAMTGELAGRLMREHLPGETGSHDVIQLSGYPQDDVAPVRIPADSVYLLGDNRDFAADSRISPEDNGVGIASVSTIVGRPLHIAWSKDHSRIGRRADH